MQHFNVQKSIENTFFQCQWCHLSSNLEGNLFFLPSLAAVKAGQLELPVHVPYLLIGAGTSSFAAFRAIKSRDPKAKVIEIDENLIVLL